MDILTQAATDCSAAGLKLQLAYFPFDQPRIMDKAVAAVRPRLMVLLETEIWPGLMMALQRRRAPAVIVNGRLSDRSLRRYRLAAPVLKKLQPQHILAVSPADAARFCQVFDTAKVAVMPNMKFDQLEPEHSAAAVNAVLARIISNQHPFVVFGSVRQEEESAVATMIGRLLDHSPQIVVGLFPRHMHRLGHWKTTLRQAGIPVTRRSRIQSPPEGGGVILWDTFGELKHAYRLAHSVFVGGSLAPLGGQNFLEPLLCGVRPVIGPHWDNFAWVGDALVSRELVRVAQTPEAAAQKMIAALKQPDDPERVRRSAMAYVQSRQGGTDKACELILNQLKGTK
jgi:3-deoxy-D-manno-octulosonic-acid transferase